MSEIYCKKLDNDDYRCNIVINQEECYDIPYNIIFYALIVWLIIVCIIIWFIYYLFRR